MDIEVEEEGGERERETIRKTILRFIYDGLRSLFVGNTGRKNEELF